MPGRQTPVVYNLMGEAIKGTTLWEPTAVMPGRQTPVVYNLMGEAIKGTTLWEIPCGNAW